MAFRCRGADNKLYNVNWRFIRGAWLSVISICNERLFKLDPPAHEDVPDVEGATVISNGNVVRFEWEPSEDNFLFVDVKINDGEWVYWVPEEWGGDNPGESFWEMPRSFYGAEYGDTIYIRAKFGNAVMQADVTEYSENYANVSTTITPFILLAGGDTETNYNLFTGEVGVSVNEGVSYEITGGNLTIDKPEAITNIYLGGTGLSGGLDISQCTNLEVCYVYNNPLITLEAKGHFFGIGIIIPEALTVINITDCPNLVGTVDLTHCPILVEIGVGDSPNLVSLIANENLDLSYVWAGNCDSLTYVSLSGMTGAGGKGYIGVYNCDLTDTAIDDMLAGLGTAAGFKAYVDVADNPGSQSCSPQIGTDKGWVVSGGPPRVFIGTATPSLADFTSDLVSADGVDVALYDDNIYIGNLVNLQGLTLSSNLQGVLDLAYATNLASLNVNGRSGITNLSCYHCDSLSALNVNGCTGIQELNVEYSILTSILGIGGLSSLINLYADGANLTGSIDIHGITTLELAYLYSNTSLTSIDVHDCTSLQIFYAFNCNLSTLNISGTTTSLVTVYLSLNNFSNTTIDAILTALPDRTSLAPGNIYVDDNPGSGTCTPSIGTAKNWVVNT